MILDYQKKRFSPLSIPGLALWLDASRLTLADLDPVTTWPDLSGNARDATQATAAKKPTFKTAIQNGKSVVRFDGVDDVLATSLAYAGTMTVIVVGRRNGTAPSASRRLWSFKPQASFYDNGTGWQWYLADTGGSFGGASGTMSVLATILNGSSSATYINGGAPATFTPNATALTDTQFVLVSSNATGADLLAGDITELLIYNSVLSAANRQKVEAYLRNRWATP